MTEPEGLACHQVVELVTAFLDGALDPVTHEQVLAHLAECPGCDVYLEQIRRTVRLTGRVTADTLSPRAWSELLAAFRGFPRGLTSRAEPDTDGLRHDGEL